MKTLLYIGNKLNDSGRTMTSIDTLGAELEKAGYDVKYASIYKNKARRLIDMVWRVLKNRKKVDFVLIDTYSTFNFYYAFFISQLCKALKLHYIPILHGGNLPDRLTNSTRLSRLIFDSAYINVSPSAYMKQEFEKNGYNNVISIPNGIHIKDYEFNTRKIESLDLLWVRSFSKIYNPNLAIDVYAALKKEYPASLCMVGPDNDGTLMEAKRYAAVLGVDVTFTGKLTKEAWIEKSKAYSIFINTTNFDNMPVSVIEAMALGLPVVSTNVGGMPFLITNGQDGLLVKPNSVEDFIKAIESLHAHSKKTQAMIVNARKKVEQFDWDIIIKQWKSVLQ